MDDSDDRVLAEDKAKHPECSYASSISTACRNVNGDRTCETMRKIYRMCPGKPKELIINSSKKEDGGAMQEEHQVDDPFQFFVQRRRKEQFGEMMDPFEAMDGFLRGMMPFGHPFDGRGAEDQMPPPHRGYRSRVERENRPKDAFEGYDGRVEEI